MPAAKPAAKPPALGTVVAMKPSKRCTAIATSLASTVPSPFTSRSFICFCTNFSTFFQLMVMRPWISSHYRGGTTRGWEKVRAPEQNRCGSQPAAQPGAHLDEGECASQDDERAGGERLAQWVGGDTAKGSESEVPHAGAPGRPIAPLSRPAPSLFHPALAHLGQQRATVANSRAERHSRAGLFLREGNCQAPVHTLGPCDTPRSPPRRYAPRSRSG
jgi:hypothetical protein